MHTVIELLQEKNELLGQFLRLTEGELSRIRMGDFENLKAFYESREDLLNVLNHIDQKVDGLSAKEDFKVTDDERASIRRLLDHKSGLVNQILGSDLEMISFIENEKSEVIKELRDVQHGRKALGAYRQNFRVGSRQSG